MSRNRQILKGGSIVKSGIFSDIIDRGMKANRIVFTVIILFLAMTGFPVTATEPVPPTEEIAFESISYTLDLDIARQDPDTGTWRPFIDFRTYDLTGHNELWLKIQIPAGKWNIPGVYIQGYFNRLEAFLEDGTCIYRSGQPGSGGSGIGAGGRRFFMKHLFPLTANIKDALTTGHTPDLYLKIPYQNPYDVGWFIDTVHAGEIDTLIHLAGNDELDSLKFYLPWLCIGAVLSFSGILLFIIFLLRFKEREYAFLSLGFFSFVTGVGYLSLVPVYAALSLSPRLWLTVDEMLTFLLPVGMVAFVARMFPSFLTPLLKKLWRFQLVLTLVVGIWFLVGIVPDAVFTLGYVTALLCIIASGTAIYKSTRSMKPLSGALKVALTGLVIFIVTAILVVLYHLGIIPFGDYSFGIGVVVLVLSFGYVLFDHYRTTMHNAQTYALELETNKQKILKLEQSTLLARFEALKSQINPHFLFNTLGTLMTLIEEDSNMAVDFVQELSRVYRYLLVIRNKRLVDVFEELAFIESYAYLVSRRYESNVSIRIDIGKKYRDRRVPPLSLQLLLENALKHNIISARRPLTVEIYVEDDSRIVVRNNLQVKNVLETSHKIGLDNLRNQYHFFTQEKVLVTSDDAYFTAKIPLLPPAQEPGNDMEETTA